MESTTSDTSTREPRPLPTDKNSKSVFARLPLHLVDHIVMMQRPNPHPLHTIVSEFWQAYDAMLHDAVETYVFHSYEESEDARIIEELMYAANDWEQEQRDCWELLIWAARNVEHIPDL